MPRDQDDTRADHRDHVRGGERDQARDENRPLVTERSPSLARAQHEHGHPSPAADPDEIAALNRLVEAEQHAADVCAAAADALARLPDASAAAGIATDLRALHQAHLRALEEVITELGASAPRPGERERVLARDPGDIAYLPGAADVLGAALATEDELAAMYERALARPAMPATARELLSRHRDTVAAQRARLTALTNSSARF